MNRDTIEQHIQNGLSIKEIAAITGVSYSTVRYYTKKFQVTPPRHTASHECDCGESSPYSFYGKTKKICKSCFNKASLQRWKAKKEKAVEYKGGKCIYCGYSKCLSALEFHHRDPAEKEFSWDVMRKQTWSKVVKELDKCDLVCANCHREQHEAMRKDQQSARSSGE